jgi:hypothetical protein
VIGTAVDVDGAGRLVVDDDNGATTVYDVGDVVHLRSAIAGSVVEGETPV